MKHAAILAILSVTTFITVTYRIGGVMISVIECGRSWVRAPVRSNQNKVSEWRGIPVRSTGITSGAETAYPTVAPVFNAVFLMWVVLLNL
jgi:hypothetical protein